MFDNSINNLIDEKYCDLTSQPERTINSIVEVKKVEVSVNLRRQTVLHTNLLVCVICLTLNSKSKLRQLQMYSYETNLARTYS